MNDDIKIVTVDGANVAEQGFFCYKSKPKSAGYQKKLSWLEQRFAEGMRIKILYEGERSVGFIEYIPGEFAWRAVNAEGYTVLRSWARPCRPLICWSSSSTTRCCPLSRTIGTKGPAAMIQA